MASRSKKTPKKRLAKDPKEALERLIDQATSEKSSIDSIDDDILSQIREILMQNRLLLESLANVLFNKLSHKNAKVFAMFGRLIPLKLIMEIKKK